MRYEILYKYGGFFMDSSMLHFKRVVDKMLSYNFVINSERPLRHRWSQTNGCFGIRPGSPLLAQLLSAKVTNRVNLWNRDALEVYGPNFFKQVLNGL